MTVPNVNQKDEIGIMVNLQERKTPIPVHNRSCLSRRRHDDERGYLPSSSNADKKSVTFSERCQVRMFRPKTEEDNLNAWYTTQDIKSFKQECVRILRYLLIRRKKQRAAAASTESRGSQHPPLQETTSTLDVSEKTMLANNETWTGLDCYLPRRTKVRADRRLVTRELVLECGRQEVEHNTHQLSWNPSWTAQQCSTVAKASALDARRAALVLRSQLAGRSTYHQRTCTTKETNGGSTKTKVVARAMSLPIRPDSAVRSSRPLVVNKAEKRLVISPMA